MGLAALIASGAVFVVAGAVLGVFSAVVKDRSKLKDAWTVYGLQFLTMGVVLVPAFIGGILFTAVVAIVGAVGLIELLGIQKEPVPTAMKVAAVVCGVATCALAHLLPFPTLYLTIPLAAATLLLVNLFLANEHRYFQSLAASLLGVVYVPVLLSHLIELRKLDDGFLIIFFMYGLSEIHDSFAYLFGKMLGRKRIFPNISPNKTWVGSASGIAAAVVAGLLLNVAVTRFSAAFAAAAISAIICFTILGDLSASKLKRTLGVKDFGTLIPRTGGVLDSYDSLVFMTPFVYYVTLLVAR